MSPPNTAHVRSMPPRSNAIWLDMNRVKVSRIGNFVFFRGEQLLPHLAKLFTQVAKLSPRTHQTIVVLR